MKQEYTFTLHYKLPESTAELDKVIDQLYQNGCDDALIGTGLPGRIALEFVREAESAEAAITSAHANVLQTLPEAKLIEAAPDYVGLTDIAALAGVSRQQMRKNYEQNVSFPAPVHAGTSAIWRLADVLDWISKHRNYSYSEQIRAVAQCAARLNISINARKSSAYRLESFNKAAEFSVQLTSSAAICFSVEQPCSTVAGAA